MRYWHRYAFALFAMAAGLLCAAATPGIAAAMPQGSIARQDSAVVRFAHDDDRLRSHCRRKVRRELGPARGRHTYALRLSFTQTCMLNGGSHW